LKDSSHEIGVGVLLKRDFIGVKRTRDLEVTIMSKKEIIIAIVLVIVLSSFLLPYVLFDKAYNSIDTFNLMEETIYE